MKYHIFALVFAGLSSIALTSVTAAHAEPVILNVEVLVDQVGAHSPAHLGQRDKLHLVYDNANVDPLTHRVKLLNMQHFIGGAYRPVHPDPAMMPTADAWLDLSREPYRFHFKANVVHGTPITIIADENTGRLTILSQTKPQLVLESGFYKIDPTPIRGAAAVAAGTDPSS